MSTYLIEVPHEPTKEACEQAIRLFLNTGSHFMTNADWGCLDGEHKAWIVLETEDKHEARNILPPAFRPPAFSMTIRNQIHSARLQGADIAQRSRIRAVERV